MAILSACQNAIAVTQAYHLSLAYSSRTLNTKRYKKWFAFFQTHSYEERSGCNHVRGISVDATFITYNKIARAKPFCLTCQAVIRLYIRVHREEFSIRTPVGGQS